MEYALGPRVGIWGTFDVPDFGNLLLPRVFEHELRKRLPHARVYPYAPLGAEHPIAMDGGRPATPLGAWTPARRAQLAEQLDLVVVGGEAIHVRDDLHRNAYPEAAPEAVAELQPSRFFVDGLGAELERRCPVAWHAVGVPFELDESTAARVRAALESKRYVSVRDEVSRARLRATGAEQDVALVPDPILLAARVFPAETLRKRLDYLRAVDAYPSDEPPLLVSGDAATNDQLEPFAGAITETAERYPRAPIVLAALAPARGDAEVVDALASRIGRPVYRLPSEVALEDLVAAFANARGFVGGSLDGYLAALAFGVPGVLVSPGRPSALNGYEEWIGDEALVVDDFAELTGAVTAVLRSEPGVQTRAVGALSGALDQHFDKLAAIAEESWSERLAAERPPAGATAELARALAEAERRYDALLEAHAARGEQLLAERLRSAELLDATEGEEGAGARVRALLELAEARNRLEIIDAERAAVGSERDAAREELERVRAERNELRAQLAQVLAENHRSTRFRRLLPRRA